MIGKQTDKGTQPSVPALLYPFCTYKRARRAIIKIVPSRPVEQIVFSKVRGSTFTTQQIERNKVQITKGVRGKSVWWTYE
jgi:hypothetical protein